MQNQGIKCRGCTNPKSKVKFYIIADDLENPKPYCKECIDELNMRVMMILCGLDPDKFICKEKINKHVSQRRKRTNKNLKGKTS